MYDVKNPTLGCPFCACCGSRVMGRVEDAKLGRLTNPNGIALWFGEAKPIDSTVSLRDTIQTKNGPITIVMRKPRG